MSRPKFLIFSADLDGNAAGFVLRNLVFALAKLADLDVVTPLFCNDSSTPPDNIRIIYSGHYHAHRWRTVDRYWRLYHCNPSDILWYLKARMRIWKSIRHVKYDVVITLSSSISIPAIMLGKHYSDKWGLDWYIYSVDALPSPIEWMEGFYRSHNRIARYIDKLCKSASIFYLSNYRMAEYEKKVCKRFQGKWGWLYTSPRSWIPCPVQEHQGVNILYTGALYGKRSVRGLIEALSSLSEKRKDIKIVFVGDIAPAFVDELKKLTSQGIAEILPFHSNLDSFYAVSDILLDIGGDMDNDIFLSSKLISYLPLERPILAISGVPSPARDVAKDCVSIVHARNDGAEIEEGILKCIQLIGKNIDDRTSLLEEFKIETTALKLFNDILNESSLDH